MLHTPKQPKQLGNIRAARDVILGDQQNYTSADLTRVEALLEQILARLRD